MDNTLTPAKYATFTNELPPTLAVTSQLNVTGEEVATLVDWRLT
jgi:hypothetical protein